ncbi:hypothetical protein MOC08_22710, partial [Bacillus haynesii]|uniref:hypothetical protein n=1 Tax=Bacillus haynesii TaxID=1925021 RepID=UPI00227E02DC
SYIRRFLNFLIVPESGELHNKIEGNHFYYGLPLFLRIYQHPNLTEPLYKRHPAQPAALRGACC